MTAILKYLKRLLEKIELKYYKKIFRMYKRMGWLEPHAYEATNTNAVKNAVKEQKRQTTLR
jgi:archaellum component FlaD/FlaE